MDRDPLDHKNLMREAFRIEGITPEECRSIFLDWALSLPDGTEMQGAIATILTRYAAAPEEHPMLQVLREGQETAARPRRRGGWKSRPRG